MAIYKVVLTITRTIEHPNEHFDNCTDEELDGRVRTWYREDCHPVEFVEEDCEVRWTINRVRDESTQR